MTDSSTRVGEPVPSMYMAGSPTFPQAKAPPLRLIPLAQVVALQVSLPLVALQATIGASRGRERSLPLFDPRASSTAIAAAVALNVEAA